MRAEAENKTAIKALGDCVDGFGTEVHFFEGLRGVNTALIERSKSEIMGSHTTVNLSTSLSAVPLMPGFVSISKHTASKKVMQEQHKNFPEPDVFLAISSY